MKKHLLALPLLFALSACGGGEPSTDPEPVAKPVSKPEIDIWTAASQGAVSIVEQHLDYGTDIDSTFVAPGIPGSGGTALHIAVLSSQPEVTALLIERGADLERKADDVNGSTPLHWAAAVGNQVGVEALLEAGADINAPDNNNATPLDAVLLNLETMTISDFGSLPQVKKEIYTEIQGEGGVHGAS